MIINVEQIKFNFEVYLMIDASMTLKKKNFEVTTTTKNNNLFILC